MEPMVSEAVEATEEWFESISIERTDFAYPPPPSPQVKKKEEETPKGSV